MLIGNPALETNNGNRDSIDGNEFDSNNNDDDEDNALLAMEYETDKGPETNIVLNDIIQENGNLRQELMAMKKEMNILKRDNKRLRESKYELIINTSKAMQDYKFSI